MDDDTGVSAAATAAISERTSGASPWPTSPRSAGELAGDDLVGAAHLAAAHELPALIREHAQVLGAHDALAYLADLQQLVLVPFTGSATLADDAHMDHLPVDSTIAGRAYQRVEVLTHPEEHGTRVWLPLLDGTERLGVLALTLPDAAALDAEDGALQVRLRRFAAIIAELVVSKSQYGDTVVRTRRQSTMGLAAEIQWNLLPPLTFACEQVVVAAALEPAYTVAGDSMDYAVDEGRARFAVFDGMGHGLHSAQLTTLAVCAYRNARRHGRPLVDTARVVDQAVGEIYEAAAFTTAVLAELDTDSGRLSWVCAGHLPPLLLRDGRLAKMLHVQPSRPFGLGATMGPIDYAVGVEHLQPGDQVLLYTDGVTEARSPDGQFFGVDRLVDLTTRHVADGLPAPETMRRLVRALLAHEQGHLRDDATLMLVEYRPGTQQRLLP